jgi:hypothetical protein
MNDPANRGRFGANDPANRRRFGAGDNGAHVAWAIGVMAAIMIGLVAWGMSDPPKTARNSPPPQTTGQGNLPPISPATPNLPVR